MSLEEFIEKIPKDKKGHLILGLIVNPFIFTIVCLFLQPIYGLIACLLFHSSIEVYQYVTKTGKFEVLDALAGGYSAICIYIIITILF